MSQKISKKAYAPSTPKGKTHLYTIHIILLKLVRIKPLSRVLNVLMFRLHQESIFENLNQEGNNFKF